MDRTASANGVPEESCREGRGEGGLWKGAETPGPIVTRRGFLAGVAGIATVPCWGGLALAQGEAGLQAEEQQRVESALPAAAPAVPRKPRRLLVFELNVGYGGHGSIPTASLAIARMGAKTGAYQTVVSKDPSLFKPESLGQFDAVFLNNTVGNLFEGAGLRQSLVEFVYRGGGLLGVHGTSVAFTRWPGAIEDWPEFGVMLGARGANHRDSDERVFIKLDDPDHPVNQPFGGRGFEYRDEFFRVHEPYSRQRVRVLLSIDTQQTEFQGQPRGNVVRDDNDYALAWVRQYGRGRVFYSTIAHNPYVFWDPHMLRFYLAAIQFAVGDLDGPATPSAKLTPSIRAQERLGWRLGLAAGAGGQGTLFEAIDRAAQLGLLYAGGSNLQIVGAGIPKPLDDRLTESEMSQIRLKLDSAGVRLLTYSVGSGLADDVACRRIFEFGRRMGAEALLCDSLPQPTDTVESLCQAHDLRLAVGGSGHRTQSVPQPEAMLAMCRGRSPRIGVCLDLGRWSEQGGDPVAAITAMKDRLVVVGLGGLGSGVPDHGTGAIGYCLEAIHRLGAKPVLFHAGVSGTGSGPAPEVLRCVEIFNKVSESLARRGQP